MFPNFSLMDNLVFYNLVKILLIVILFSIIYYLQLGGNLKKYIINNWSYYKCKPYILPFAGFFRPPEDTNGFLKFTFKNFKKCQWANIKIFFSYFI